VRARPTNNSKSYGAEGESTSALAQQGAGATDCKPQRDERRWKFTPEPGDWSARPERQDAAW